MRFLSATYIIYGVMLVLLFAILAGMLAAWVWAFRRLMRGQSLLPRESWVAERPVPWGLGTAVLVFVLYVGVNVTVARFYAAATGRLPLSMAREAGKLGQEGMKGAGVAGSVRQAPGSNQDAQAPRPLPQKPVGNPQPTQTSAELMFQLAVINIVLIVLVPMLIGLTSGASLSDLGIHGERWPQQLAIGVVGALLVTPAVYAIQAIAVRIWRSSQHPVEDMVLQSLNLEAAFLAVISTMILAPVIEEMLFRAIIQGWMSRLLNSRPPFEVKIGSTNGSGLSEMTLDAQADSFSMSNPPAASSNDPNWPYLTLASAIPIVLTSLGFAAVHAAQWPAPVAIFLLSMAIGLVYETTGSLLAAIAMHGVFNGFSTLGLFLQALQRLMIESP